MTFLLLLIFGIQSITLNSEIDTSVLTEELRPLRDQVSDETLTGTSFEIQTIQNSDVIVIAPKDHWLERHG